MTKRTGTAALLGLALAWVAAETAPPVAACSLCMNIQQSPTFRQEAGKSTARLILAGTLQNPKVGATELHIETVLRSDPVLGDRKMIVLPRFLPVSDPKNPPRFLVFCDVYKNTLDPFRGVPCRSEDT